MLDLNDVGKQVSPVPNAVVFMGVLRNNTPVILSVKASADP